MKVPISWLKEYLDLASCEPADAKTAKLKNVSDLDEVKNGICSTKAGTDSPPPLGITPDELAKVLTLAGIEVDAVVPTPLKFSGVVVGKILSARPHPHADQLRIATVSDGAEEFQVVCGAANCREGIKTAFAKIGAVLQEEDGKSFKIKKAKLRDIESFGMLCGADELGLSESSDGIMEIEENWAVGSLLSDYYSDVILDLSLTPNLGHCMSIAGIAREISAQLNIPLKQTSIALQESEEAIETLVSVQLIDKRQCGRYACRIVKGVKVGPSPNWLKKKLEGCGLKSINNVVDIGNLVMLQYGQPLHLFNYNQIEGKKILVTAQTEFKEMETLDNAARPIPPEVLLICDSKKPLAFAGVIGGKNSAIDEQTTDVLIESAYFTPQSIRKSSKWLGLKTDSSQRFEKGTDPNGVLEALDAAAALLQQIAGGSIARGIIDISAHPFAPRKINCRPSRVNQLLGTQLSTTEISTCLQRLGMEIVEEKGNEILVAVPTNRHDINGEIDLVEEVARVYGYNNIPKVTPLHTNSTILHAPLYEIEKKVRHLLVGAGLQEMITCDLIHPDQAAMTAENAMGKESLIPVLQPSSLDQSVLRASLIAGLLQVVKYNCDHGNRDVRGFEVGRIHFQENGRYFEPSTAGIILSGMRAPYHWDPKTQECDFYDLKGIVENLFTSLNIEGIAFEVSHLHNFHPGRQVRIKKGEASLGIIGEVHPEHVQRIDIDQRVYYAEINLNELLPLLQKIHTVSELPQFPGSERDWTITLEESFPIGNILSAARSIPSKLLETVQLLGLYKSEQIGKNKKNATFRFFYRDREKTIALETVEREHSRITSAVAEMIKKE